LSYKREWSNSPGQYLHKEGTYPGPITTLKGYQWLKEKDQGFKRRVG